MSHQRKLTISGCVAALPLAAWFAFGEMWPHRFDTFPYSLKTLIGCSMLLSPLLALGGFIGVVWCARIFCRSRSVFPVLAMCYSAALAAGYSYVTYEMAHTIANFPVQH